MALVLRAPGTRESLKDEIADLGRVRKIVSFAAGVCALAAVLLGGLTLLGLLDAGYHLPPLARALGLVCLLALAGVVWVRGIARALALRTDSLSVALDLEQEFTGLNDALASAVSFLDGPDAESRGVSNRLESAAVRSAKRLADRYEFRRVIPTGSLWRSLWALGLIVAAIVPLVLANSGRAEIALVRIADPFGAHSWPTKTRIEIIAPESLPSRMPKGDPFELKFAVRGVVKERASVVFRLANGDEFEENYPLSAGNDPSRGGAAVVATKVDSSRLPGSFEFRILSNDADTDWQRVEVVPPPRLIPLDGRATPQFRIEPPAYTGKPVEELPEGAVVLELPVGTAVWMRAATDVSLSSACLAYLGEKTVLERGAPLTAIGYSNPLFSGAAASLAAAIGDDIPLALDPSGRTLTGAFVPSLTGMYALRMTDESGLTGTRLIEIRLIADPPPIVTLLRPAAGRDPAILTPNSSIPLHVAGDDKLYGVRRAVIEYRVGREGRTRELVLADLRAARNPALAIASCAMATARPRPTTLGVARVVPVAAFLRDDGAPVRSGDLLLIRGAVDDWDDVSPVKEPGRSEGEVEILIASAEAIEAWLQQELAALRPELIRLRDQQRDARGRTGDVIPRPDGSLLPADRDRLLTAEQQQRQIRGKVGDPRDGLLARAEAMRATVQSNNLPKSTTSERVARVADELVRLAERELPVIEPTLAEARQAGGQPASTGQAAVVPDLLRRADRHQRTVEESLNNLLDLLAVWGGASEIRGEARVLRDQVNRLASETDQLGNRIPTGVPAAGLTPLQRTELDRAATRTEQAAEQAGSLLARALKLAAERDHLATSSRTLAAAHDILAGVLAAAADALLPGDPRRSAARADAASLKSEADDLRGGADAAQREADALRKGVQDAGGQELPFELRKAADALRGNQQQSAADLQRSAAARLGRLAAALAEKETDAAPDLKKWRSAADDVNTLADAQDDLRKRAVEAGRIADPEQREAALQRLAAEQDRLIERGKSLFQRLTRDKADAAARETRAAIDRMQNARDDLERGDPGLRAQNDAVDRLDSARDRLDAAANQPNESLADEKRRKMADKIKGLLDRHLAAAAEAERIHKLIAAKKGWERPVLQSYKALEDLARELGFEVKELSQKEFVSLPVLARLLTESAAAMELSAEKMKVRREDAIDADPGAAFDPELESANDRKVARPMNLAVRRLQQLFDVLKREDPKSAPKKESGEKKGPGSKGQGTPPGGGGDPDVVPPLVQLKVLKALQAELNELTAEFAKTHPDPAKLTEEEREQLKDLERAQREIAALFEELTRLFDEAKHSKPDRPEPERAP